MVSTGLIEKKKKNIWAEILKRFGSSWDALVGTQSNDRWQFSCPVVMISRKILESIDEPSEGKYHPGLQKRFHNASKKDHRTPV